MAYTLLNDYDNNYAETEVKVAIGGYQATLAQENDSFEFKGTIFSKTVTNSGGYKHIYIQNTSGNTQIINDYYADFMEAAGLGYIQGEWQANILSWLPRDGLTHRFGAGTNSVTYPLISAKYTETESGSNHSQRGDIGLAATAYAGQSGAATVGVQGYTNTIGYACFLALDTRTEAEYGGYVFGYITFFSNHNSYSGQSRTELNIYYSENINTRVWNNGGVSPDAGQKGFKPVGDRTKPNSPVGGGGRSGQVPPYTTDTIELPGEPNESYASAIGSGFVNVYKVEESQLRKIGNILFDPDFDGRLKQLVSNPIDCLISLNVFPCTPHIGSSEYIRGFGFNFKFEDDSDSASGHRLSQQFKTFDFGSVVIPEQWESYLDYDATSVTLFLPFIGEVDLPTAEVMGSTVNVTYTVDFLTGMCVANVGITKAVSIGDRSVSNKAVHSYQGNCAVNIPLTAVNYGAMVGSFINAANTGLRSGIAGGLSSLASDIVSGGFKPTVTTKGTLSANAGFCGVLYPYITINRPIPVECDNYQEVEGYPSYINNTIGSLQGLCVCDAIDLSGITGATASEIARLEQLCKEGVRN